MGDVDLPSKGKIFVIFNRVRKITNIGAELDFSQMEEERLRRKEERKKDRMERLDSKMDYTFLLVMEWREEINCL